jgi:hypothetical protein
MCFATASLARAMIDQRALLAQQRVRAHAGLKAGPQVAHVGRA